jgi:lipopolysaccharide transport protein LptA
MRRLAICALLLFRFAAPELLAQDTAPRTTSPGRARSVAATTNNSTQKSASAKPAANDPLKGVLGSSSTPPNQPITTQVYSDEAFFDTKNSVGIFKGHVIVNDPRFNIQADKLTVNMAKGEARGLEKAVAEGNVGVVRDTPGENGGPPTRAVGRSDRAVYTTADGNVELSGTPRVQSGLNTHVATSPDTVMLINQSGQLTTKGPSRTEIRQEPKAAPTPTP